VHRAQGGAQGLVAAPHVSRRDRVAQRDQARLVVRELRARGAQGRRAHHGREGRVLPGRLNGDDRVTGELNEDERKRREKRAAERAEQMCELRAERDDGAGVGMPVAEVAGSHSEGIEFAKREADRAATRRQAAAVAPGRNQRALDNIRESYAALNQAAAPRNVFDLPRERERQRLATLAGGAR
jgi:hypothetical protein